MTKLIWNPDVFVMGQTQFDGDSFQSWIELNHTHVADGTPLAHLWHDVDDAFALERMIEFGGRHCYRAWDAGRPMGDYIRNIIEMQHGSVLEHSSVNFAIQGVSRSLSLELVRHRVGVGISQESQRYVDASEVQFVVPPLVSYLAGGAFSNADEVIKFTSECERARAAYISLQESIVKELDRRATKQGGVKADTMAKKRANEAARAHLPNAAETRLLWSPNMRLLRHVLWLRGGNGADLEIRRLALAMFDAIAERAPSVFSDMTISEADGSYGVPVIVARNA